MGEEQSKKFKTFEVQVISGKRFIRNSLFPVCVISCVGSVIVEMASSAIFAAQM